MRGEMEKKFIEKKRIFIISFTSANYSLKLYKILKEKNYNVAIISTPCKISSGCSRSLEIYEDHIYYAIDEIINEKILIHGIYEKILEDNIWIYKEIDLNDIKEINEE